MKHNILKSIALLLFAIFTYSNVYAADKLDADGYPIMYVRGTMTYGWSVQEAYRMTRTGDTYTISLAQLDGEFKVSGTEWNLNYGATGSERITIDDATTFKIAANGPNIIARNLQNVTIEFVLVRNGNGGLDPSYMRLSANGKTAPVVEPNKPYSGTLPVLYINVTTADGTAYDNEIIDRNLSHKNYFAGTYYLDLNGCEYFEQLGAQSIGSKENPLPLQIKARGNYTRTGFSKKPFKLKLDKKQSLLGLSKSKHFALLAHADDNCGYLRNFTGFALGRRIGLPWTPAQQPVEVVINGDYRGLYFLTESIRVEGDRVDITELADNVTDGTLVSGGYLVELDNYDEDDQIRMKEETCIPGKYTDMLRITPDTPEEYSELQRRFVTDQFTAMNQAVGRNSDDLWQYLDMDDAVRYYIVTEMISHTEAFHGSTYLFRDFGEGQKWHFSPLWDMGNAFNGATDNCYYNNSPYGNTWIPAMRCNATFNSRLVDTWMWFMTNGFDGLEDEIDQYVGLIATAAQTDHKRWGSAPLPDSDNRTAVADNSDMASRRNKVLSHLQSKIDWLRRQWGDYTACTAPVAEPAPDATPAAPLPEYARPAGVESIVVDTDAPAIYYNLQGCRVQKPRHGQFYIECRGKSVQKIIF